MAARTSTAHHSKMTEKKIIDEKIAKVKEVVKNISNNDIMLALYNFDLDVERTIHAFCEGGFQTALGDWEKTSASKKKRNNKKKSKPTDDRSNGSGSALKGGIGPDSCVSSVTNSEGYPPQPQLSNMNRHQQEQSLPNNTNGNLPLSDDAKEFNAGKKLQLNGSGVFPINTNENLPSSDGIISTETKVVATIDDVTGLDENMTHLKQYKTLFDDEITTAQNNIQQCFKELHDALSLREQQLLTDLFECKRNGQQYFATREDILHKLLNKDKKQAVSVEWENFNSAKTEDLETALTARFFYDDYSPLVASIQQIGRVIPVKKPSFDSTKNWVPKMEEVEKVKKNSHDASPAYIDSSQPAAQTRRSNSPSSLVSSIDSGLGGQISPVNQEKGPVAQVEENGIMLKSDTISADQLAEIQRNIVESLKAKGIDPSILADLNTAAVRRRPPSHQQAAGRAQKNAEGRGGGGEKSGGNNDVNGGGAMNNKQQRQTQSRKK